MSILILKIIKRQYFHVGIADAIKSLVPDACDMSNKFFNLKINVDVLSMFKNSSYQF